MLLISCTIDPFFRLQLLVYKHTFKYHAMTESLYFYIFMTVVNALLLLDDAFSGTKLSLVTGSGGSGN